MVEIHLKYDLNKNQIQSLGSENEPYLIPLGKKYGDAINKVISEAERMSGKKVVEVSSLILKLD